MQSSVLLGLVYFVVLGPSVLVGRLFGIRLIDTDTRSTPTWHAREPLDPSIDSLTRQF